MLRTLQVYMLEKRMLDPRRPVGTPSKDDQLEGLMPYQSSLPISPLLYATHSKQVAQLSGKTLQTWLGTCMMEYVPNARVTYFLFLEHLEPYAIVP